MNHRESRPVDRDLLLPRDRPARLVAFYLPQFHPIPENDAWWGKGFSEWSNVARAKPLFRGHKQPKLPADLGFYDLRLPEVRIAQARLAQAHGIEAFCYWHYWFGGKRLLERPFEEVLRAKEPDFPFCLGWANQSWTGVWHGNPKRILIEQTYPGMEDYKAHFATVLPAFLDKRYLTVDAKPFFLIADPWAIPDLGGFVTCWRILAEKAGLPGLHLVGYDWGQGLSRLDLFDAATGGCLPPIVRFDRHNPRNSALYLYRRLRRRPVIWSYQKAMVRFNNVNFTHPLRYPVLLPNWDNTPRCGLQGIVLTGCSPVAFRRQIRLALRYVAQRKPEDRLILIKSWNEWAEGNYLEPDQEYGLGYLEALADETSP